MKKVLILGAGMVARPIVNHLLSKGYFVTVVDVVLEKAVALVGSNPNSNAASFSVDDEQMLDKAIADHDLTVSLLPYAFHVKVAKHCIAHKKNMVTTSYVKPEMQALDENAKNAGIIILNELGLDPGLDHMYSMRIIDHVHAKGGKIEEFYSLCGALPAPEACDNPFNYKFSWSPKGVVMAGNNDAQYLYKAQNIKTPTEDLFKDTFCVDFPQVGNLEVYPNRDSIQYIDIYSIPEVKTMFRGTFRYKGWCETLDVIKKLGLITYNNITMEGKTYAELLAYLIGADDSENIKQQVADYLGIDIHAHAIKALEWLGLFEEKLINRTEDSTFELVSDLMIDKMQLGQNERDMVAMLHVILASYPDGSKEVIKARMLDFGSPANDTSVARTVALPAAVGVELILEGIIKVKGVFRPVIPEIYNPVLERLEDLNINMIEEYGLPESDNIKKQK